MTTIDSRRIQALCRWFDRYARDLPWRGDRSPYAALVAEAMLQQTQVARVIDRYETFMRRFPTVEALAAAGEQDVLAAWQGLGYYRRARSLHAAARMIVETFGGKVPDRLDDLLRLPGIGRYSAGSIASIVYGHAEPIVDGNVRRVLARWDADHSPPDDPAAERRAWRRAAELVTLASRPGVFNEAMMEFGATICTPRSPKCDLCAVTELCQSRQQGREKEIPPPKRQAPRSVVHHHAIVIQRGNLVLLEQRPVDGLWSNMWQPPTIEAGRKLARAKIASSLPFSVSRLEILGEFVHQTTHRHVTFHVHRATTRIRRGEWYDATGIARLPISNAHHRVLRVAGVDSRAPD